MQAEVLFSHFVTGVIGAVIGATSSFVHQLWRYSRDQYLARINETCDLIFEAADEAANYFLTDQPAKTRRAACRELEAKRIKIEGFQQKINVLRLLVRNKLGQDDQELLIERTASFFSSITGGDFSDPKRKADISRSRLVYRNAVSLVNHIRRASAAPYQRRCGYWLRRWGFLVSLDI